MDPFNDEFFDEVGWGDLPDDVAAALRAHITAVFEVALGARMAAAAGEGAADEFASFLEGDPEIAAAWLDEHRPEWRETDLMLSGDAPADAALTLAAEHWVNVALPDLRQVAAEQIRETREILRRHSEAILEQCLRLHRLINGDVRSPRSAP